MVAHGEDAEAGLARLDHDPAAGVIGPRARACDRDARIAHVLEGVDQSVGSVVERMVVGQSDGVYPDGLEAADRCRRTPEEEALAPYQGGGLSPLGDTALEVADHGIAGIGQRPDFGRPYVRRAHRGQLGGDPATQHHVPEQGECRRHGAVDSAAGLLPLLRAGR